MDGTDKADGPRKRLRGNFADVLGHQLSELSALALECADPDVADALVAELDRIRGTAEVLGVTDVVRAARAAIASVHAGQAIEGVAAFEAACRDMDEAAGGLFHPVLLVGVTLPTPHAWAWMVRHEADVPGALRRRGGVAAYVVRAELAEALAAGLRRRGSPVPFYVVGERHDFGPRLAAARLGAAGYLSEPVDMGVLLSRVRLTDDAVEWLPARVLVVHPDARVAEALRATLAGPDLLVRHLVDGANILPALDAFWPDLLLLSPSAGSVRGLDLIAVLRGHASFADLPVLMLGADEQNDDPEQLDAPDEVLGRITPGALRARVRAWVRRVRWTRSSQEDDLATGVRSRGALLRALEREIGLSRRGGVPLAVAVLDVDGLANLNAAAGAPAGDRVLRALAGFVGGVVRRTDLVGRTGADSFCLLMPLCSEEDAERRVEEIRAEFTRWADESGVPDISFSAGVADTLRGHHDVLTRAHRALQAARRAGGGRSAVSGD